MSGMHNMLMGIGGALVDSQTLTAEYVDDSDDPKFPIGPWWGYTNSVIGTLTDGTSNIYSGASILTFLWDETPSTFRFVLLGVYANSGWSKMIITHVHSGTVKTFYRVSASYSTTSAPQEETTTWEWSTTNVFPNVTPGQNTYLIKFYR